MILILIILFALYNHYIIQWYQTRAKKYSVKWHFVGGLIRVLLILAICDYNLIHSLGWILIQWVVYDAFLNLFRKLPFFYKGSGTGSQIDNLFSNQKIYIICKILSIISGAVLLLFF